mmetsp:Transcript_5639/g.12522  ORF Transcript_5639/g.12522 Transcript_5639/m.12522 type:complete len:268 (-) Transcript_5639:59-862(-)
MFPYAAATRSGVDPSSARPSMIARGFGHLFASVLSVSRFPALAAQCAAAYPDDECTNGFAPASSRIPNISAAEESLSSAAATANAVSPCSFRASTALSFSSAWNSFNIVVLEIRFSGSLDGGHVERPPERASSPRSLVSPRLSNTLVASASARATAAWSGIALAFVAGVRHTCLCSNSLSNATENALVELRALFRRSVPSSVPSSVAPLKFEMRTFKCDPNASAVGVRTSATRFAGVGSTDASHERASRVPSASVSSIQSKAHNSLC